MRSMKIMILSLLGAAVAAMAAPAQINTPKLDDSEVRISYAELKRLLAAAQPVATVTVSKAPPVSAALLSAVYHIDWQAAQITAQMQVENFSELWQSIPLAGAALGAVSVKPADARIVVMDDQLCLITDKAGAVSLELCFALPAGTSSITLHPAPSAVAAIETTALPEGHHLSIQHAGGTATLMSACRHALPASGGVVTLTLADSKAPAFITGTDEAIISTATYTTQVVRDGSVLTEGTLIARHDSTIRLTLLLPEQSKLLQCHVNGTLTRPLIQNGTQLDIPLAEPTTDGAESEIKLSYTSAQPALQLAEGEIDLALPQTPVFARQIDWTVQLPDNYDLSTTGNIDAITDPKPGLHLRKSLCRDQQPQARITYRKRTTK